MIQKDSPLIAKTLQGLEDILAEELTLLGANNIKKETRGVSFTGDNELLYKANLHCRTAIRILKPIASFQAKDADEIYKQIKKINWEEYLSTKQSFAISSVVYSETFSHSKFVTYKVKDAIVDYFKEKFQERPTVRITNPDIYLNIHIAHTTCTISLDSSGESLHKRGYRNAQTEAPLNEVLAAGLIMLTGWRGESDFLDPMCGSGTILIEAAMIALNIPPGVFRKEFAFEKWTDFDSELFDKVYNDDSNERTFAHKIYGSDNSAQALQIAEENCKSAGLSKYIHLQKADFTEMETPANKTLIVTNPPYGERIGGNSINKLYAEIGETLKHRFPGSEAWIISSNMEGFYKIGLRPSKKYHLLNGSIECEYRQYELFDGKMKEKKATDNNRKPYAKDGDKRNVK